VSGQISVAGLIQSGLVKPQDAAKVGAEIGAQRSAAAATFSANAITLKNVTTSGKAVQFDALAFMAPGMALMFLMYTVSNGGRTLLAERLQGTLPRLMVSPTASAQVLGGKVFGIYLTGVAQMLILVGGCTLLFGLSWGDPLGVVVLILAAVAGAIGWGMLITAMARTPGQVASIGAAIMLTFGMLGGTFINLSGMPAWFQVISKITPNAWGLDGFTVLGMGGSLGDILTPILALLAMGAILFGAAVLIINRRGLIER
jgi:ABC-2 type transport system permease protein